MEEQERPGVPGGCRLHHAPCVSTGREQLHDEKYQGIRKVRRRKLLTRVMKYPGCAKGKCAMQTGESMVRVTSTPP